MALTYSKPAQLGSLAPAFSLPGVDDKTYELKDFYGSSVLVVVFMCNHCPYVIAVEDRMTALARLFRSSGVQWVGINSNDSERYPEDSFEKMKQRAKDKGFVFPYLWDETQSVAKSYGAVCTPDFFLYKRVPHAVSPNRFEFQLQYQGRLDDSWKDESQVKSQDLKQAIEHCLSGLDPLEDQKPSMGCSIKWKPASE
ncbi:MAG: thioredoxin family protein [Bdellovibrionia bacterium]